MTLVTVAELLLKLPLMHPQQLKKKASRPISSRIPDCTSTRSTSYLKTRIRGSRLQNAARLLVLIKLTQRLHQAYRYAYDKQASDRLLPQNPIPTGELERIRGDVEKSIAKCADYLKALFDEAAVQTGQPYRDIMVTFDNIKFLYGTPGPGHGGEASGSFERGNATALIREFKENFVSTDRSAFIRTQTAQNFLGETIHQVGTNGAYRDAPLANALNTVLVRQGRGEKPQVFSERTSAEINTASWYLHDRVFTAWQMRY